MTGRSAPSPAASSALALAFAAALAATACPSRTPDPDGPSDDPEAARPGTGELAAELVIPVPSEREDRIQEILAELDERADAGDSRAAWARAHYLLDLFDDARFRRADASLRALTGALARARDDTPGPAEIGGRPPRGPEATDRALRGLGREIDRVAAQDRLHDGARAARTLAAFDTEPPESRDEARRAIASLEAVARRSAALEDNARLRLFAYGRRAFEDATRAPWRDRRRVLAHALYPLYGADPEPYFADDPAERPPPPDPDELAEELPELLSGVVTGDGRLADAAEAQRDHFFQLARERADDFPSPLDPDALELPRAEAARPYDASPLLTMEGTGAGEAEDLAEGVASAVAGDGRGRLAVALPAGAPGRGVLRAARVAELAGARELELVVATTQRYRPPRGDYWEARLSGDRVTRAGIIPVAVATARRDRGPADAETDSPEARREGAAAAEPEAGARSLYVRVGRETWEIVAPDGALAPIATAGGADEPKAELSDRLAQVRELFPDRRRLMIVPGEEASYAAVIAAASAARSAESAARSAESAEDAALEGRGALDLALAAEAPAPARDVFETRLTRRAAATVALDPEGVFGEAERVLLHCYRRLLDERPGLEGEVHLDLGDGGAIDTRAESDLLATCSERALADAMRAEGISRARVRLVLDRGD